MITAKYYVIFNRRNKLNKQGKASIEIAVSLKRKQKFIATGIYIKPVQWDIKNRRIKGNDIETAVLNSKIDDKIAELKRIEQTCLLENKEFNLDMLKKNNTQDIKSFSEFFIEEINKRNDIVEDTRRSMITVYKSFVEFAGNIKFNEIDYNLISDFDRFLRNKGYAPHTIKTRHKTLKTYLNLAIKKGLMDANNYPYRNFKVKDAKSKRIDLSFAELEKLENLKLTGELDYVRDLFLFSCYTGLRFEDVMDLKKEHIKKQTDGTYEIKKRIIKNGDEIRLPISILFKGKSLKIIEKYTNEQNKIFKKRTNQAVNRILKVLALMTDYKQNLTYHIARHTFGSRLAELKPDPYLIKELMGHKDIKTSMIYIKTSSNVLTNKLKNINW
jgi:integrase